MPVPIRVLGGVGAARSVICSSWSPRSYSTPSRPICPSPLRWAIASWDSTHGCPSWVHGSPAHLNFPLPGWTSDILTCLGVSLPTSLTLPRFTAALTSIRLPSSCHVACPTTSMSSLASAETLLPASLPPPVPCLMQASPASASYMPRWRQRPPSLSLSPPLPGPQWAGSNAGAVAREFSVLLAFATHGFLPTSG